MRPDQPRFNARSSEKLVIISVAMKVSNNKSNTTCRSGVIVYRQTGHLFFRRVRRIRAGSEIGRNC